MIRINLLPSRKKKAAKKSAAVSTDTPKGALIFVVMMVGWIGGGAGAWFVQTSVETEATELRAEAGKLDKKIKELRKQIDEERLEAIKRKNEQLNAAIDKLNAQRVTPVYVMHELANVLTLGGQLDIDAEKQLQREANDPLAKLNPAWDGTSVWINSIGQDKGGALEIKGGARAESDLHEFVKRMRASARFGTVTHPHFQEVGGKKRRKGGSSEKDIGTYLSFSLTATVNYWD